MEDVIQVREEVILLQVQKVPGAGVQVRAGDVVVDADPTRPVAGPHEPGLSGPRAGLSAQGDAPGPPVCPVAVVCWREAFDRERLGEGSWLVVLGDMHHQVLLGVKLMCVVVLVPRVPQRCPRKHVQVFEVHAPALVGLLAPPLLQARRAPPTAAILRGAALGSPRGGARKPGTAGGGGRALEVAVWDLDALHGLEALGLLPQHRTADHQAPGPPLVPPLRAFPSQRFHAFQERLGSGPAGLLILWVQRVLEPVFGGRQEAAAHQRGVQHDRAVGAVLPGALEGLLAGAVPAQLAAAVAPAAAFAVNGADLGLAQICEDAFTAGRVSHPNVSRQPISVSSRKQCVEVVHARPPAAGSLESPFVADAEIFLIGVVTLENSSRMLM